MYKSIGSVSCPAFEGKNIYFTETGFDHLIFKGRLPRKQSEQMRRLKLLPKALLIVQTAEKIQEYRILRSGNSIVHIWKIQSTHSAVNVIIRKVDKGNLQFFSVFN